MLIAFMLASTLLAALIGFAAALPFWAMTALLALYGTILMLDSASLTVGAMNAADPERRGSTLAVHTTLGTTMAFLAPLASGLALDLTGGGATVRVVGRVLSRAGRRCRARPARALAARPARPARGR